MKKLLLVIDMQEGFRFTETESIIQPLKDLLGKFEGDVAFTKFIDKKGSIFEKQLNWTVFQSENNQKILKELGTFCDTTFEHKTYNPIIDEVLEFIKYNNIEQVYLAGIYTDVSILFASMYLFDEGIETFVVKNCCNSVHKNQNNNLHESGLESISHILGEDHIININLNY